MLPSNSSLRGVVTGICAAFCKRQWQQTAGTQLGIGTQGAGFSYILESGGSDAEGPCRHSGDGSAASPGVWGALGGRCPHTFTLAAPSCRPSASGAPATSHPHPSCPYCRCEPLGASWPLGSAFNALGSRLGSWGPHTGSDSSLGLSSVSQSVCPAAAHRGPVPFQKSDHPGPCSWCPNNAHPLAPGEQADPARPQAQPPGAVLGPTSGVLFVCSLWPFEASLGSLWAALY